MSDRIMQMLTFETGGKSYKAHKYGLIMLINLPSIMERNHSGSTPKVVEKIKMGK